MPAPQNKITLTRNAILLIISIALLMVLFLSTAFYYAISTNILSSQPTTAEVTTIENDLDIATLDATVTSINNELDNLSNSLNDIPLYSDTVLGAYTIQEDGEHTPTPTATKKESEHTTTKTPVPTTKKESRTPAITNVSETKKIAPNISRGAEKLEDSSKIFNEIRKDSKLNINISIAPEIKKLSLKEKLSKEEDRRVEVLTELKDRITNSTHLTDEQKTTLIAKIDVLLVKFQTGKQDIEKASDDLSLNKEKQKLENDHDDFKSILPKASATLAADRLTEAATRIDTIMQKLLDKINKSVLSDIDKQSLVTKLNGITALTQKINAETFDVHTIAEALDKSSDVTGDVARMKISIRDAISLIKQSKEIISGTISQLSKNQI